MDEMNNAEYHAFAMSLIEHVAESRDTKEAVEKLIAYFKNILDDDDCKRLREIASKK